MATLELTHQDVVDLKLTLSGRIGILKDLARATADPEEMERRRLLLARLEALRNRVDRLS